MNHIICDLSYMIHSYSHATPTISSNPQQTSSRFIYSPMRFLLRVAHFDKRFARDSFSFDTFTCGFFMWIIYNHMWFTFEQLSFLSVFPRGSFLIARGFACDSFISTSKPHVIHLSFIRSFSQGESISCIGNVFLGFFFFLTRHVSLAPSYISGSMWNQPDVEYFCDVKEHSAVIHMDPQYVLWWKNTVYSTWRSLILTFPV